LTDGQSYDQDVFHQPKVSAKFFNSKTTFEIAVSFTEKQVKESFNSATELNSFLSMISTTVQNALTVSIDALIERTINNLIGCTLAKGIGSGTAGAITIDLKKSSPIAVNLLKLYNDSVPTAQAVKKANALSDFHFLRFAVATINQYQARLTKISELFNIEGTKKFTPLANQILLVHADFKSSAEVIVDADMQNKEITQLTSNADVVPYWQGTGKDYAFGSTSKVNVKTSTGETIAADGIVAVLA
ncbi:phage major capsid protein, partial [Herbiconiux daphne]